MFTTLCARLRTSLASGCHDYMPQRETQNAELWEMNGTGSVLLTFLLAGGIRAVSLVGLPQLAIACKGKDKSLEQGSGKLCHHNINLLRL